MQRLMERSTNRESAIACIIRGSSTELRMDSSAPSTTATGSTNYHRVSFPSRDRQAAKFRAIAEDIPLSLLCFSFGPLIYVASLGTVAAMLLLAACMLIASALGISARRAITAVDFAPGAHSTRVFTDLN